MKAVFSLALLTLLCAGLAFGQVNSAMTTAIFSVGDPIEVDILEGDWGVLAPGVTYTITPSGIITPPTLDGDVEVGSNLGWTIAGGEGASVLITIALPAYFDLDGGAGVRIPYSVNSQSAGWSEGEFADGDPFTPFDPRVPQVITLLGGEAAVQLGGVISIPPGAGVSGDTDYIAYFVLTAAYTGL